MQHRQNFRRDANHASSLGGSRQNSMADQSQNPTANESGTDSDLRNGEQQERQPERCQSYSVVAPNERKRRELLQQRERNMQCYEEAKAKNRMMYDSGRPQKIGGPSLSKDRLLEKRIREQKRAEALEKSKVYEKKKKREKWAAEKKELEEKEINEKKQKARAQAERNEEKRRQEEIARKQKYDDERRRRWENSGSSGALRDPEHLNSSSAGVDCSPNADELREIYIRRYDRKQSDTIENERQRSYDLRMPVRSNFQQVSQRRSANESNTSLHECIDDFSNLSTEDDTFTFETGEEDIQKLCQMFPHAERELIADIYLQTNSSLAETWRILSTQ